MAETTYSIEYAKSGRSKCKKCKEPIAKGDMRMCITVEREPFDVTSNHHVGCFKLPRKFVTGANQMTPTEFLQEHVTDTSDAGEILPDKLDEIAQLLEQAASTTTKRKKSDEEDSSLMGRIKAAAAAKEDDEPKNKKQKTEGDFHPLVEAYKQHAKTKSDNLKDILRWNTQVLKGNKDFVLFKVIDGQVHGRLGMCALCGGKLKIEEEDIEKVECSGRFDEEISVRIPCSFRGDRTSDKTPRYQPFYLEEPSEEEKEAMDKLIEEAQGGDSENQGSNSHAGKELLQQAESMDWKLTDKQGIQAATAELVELVSGKIDIPEDNMKMNLGSIVVGNKDKSPKEIMEVVIKKYGFKADKEAKAAAREAQTEGAAANPKNAPLLLAFQELGELYFKEGNRNAGASYTKVAKALKDLELEVTADNAMSLCKAKTKVPGIGKGSAQKMKEFCETGTMEKLEEKRANNA